MKKIYTLILCLAAMTMAATAQTPVKKSWENSLFHGKKATEVLTKGTRLATPIGKAKVATRSGQTGSRNLSYCKGSYDEDFGFYTSYGDSVMMAIGFAASDLQGFKNGTITTVRLPINEPANTLRAYGWIALNDLSNKVAEARVATIEKGWAEVTLPEGITVTGDDDIYVGASFVTPLDVEYTEVLCTNLSVSTAEGGCYLGSTFVDNPTYWEDKNYSTWEDYAGAGMGNVAVEAVVEGVTIPDRDLKLTDADVTIECMKLNKTQPITFTATNNGVETITSFDVESYVNGEKVQTDNFTCNLALDEEYSGSFELVHGLTANTKGAEVTLKAVNINGQGDDDDMTNNDIDAGSFDAYETLYARNMVVEEGTGTWCGYCVYGIWGMEQMRETYPDSFIGLAIHYDDEMDCGFDEYGYCLYDYSGYTGYPSANIDRTYTDVYPEPETLQAYYDYQTANETTATISGKAYWDNDKLCVKGQANFCFDDEPGMFYTVCTVLVEDEVGPYYQTNYMSGSNYYVGGWEEKDDSVSTVYNDVVRGMYPDFYGSPIESAYYNGITAGESIDFEFSYDIENSVNYYVYNADGSVTEATRDRYQDKSNLRVVLMLLEMNETGAVLNATKCAIAADEASAISSVTSPADHSREYFTLDGRRVSSPSKGLMIERVGGKVTKRIVR